jgi:hypothetical protein
MGHRHRRLARNSNERQCLETDDELLQRILTLGIQRSSANA